MDANEIYTLLHIAEKTMSFPKLKSIHEAAMAKLESHAAEISVVQAPEPEPSPEPEQDIEEDTEERPHERRI